MILDQKTPRLFAIALALLLGALSLRAQDAAPSEANDSASFDKKSLALRTALHYDPSLASPLNELIKLYQGATRSEELIGLYRSHLTQYPADAGARVTYINLLRLLGHPESGNESAAAKQQYPDHPLVARARYEVLKAQGESSALDELSRAITLSTLPGQKRLWVEELANEAPAAGRSELAESHLKSLAEDPNLTPNSQVDLARTILAAGFAELALKTVSIPLTQNTLEPEGRIEAELLAARAETSSDNREAAGERLDRVLNGVAADYWRRPEIVALRVNLIDSDSDRATRLSTAREAYQSQPNSEAAALDLAELLAATELRSEALDTLLAASATLPKSERIERAALDLAERLGDDFKTVEFLSARLIDRPERSDLRYRYIKALYATGDRETATSELEILLQQIDPAARTDRTLELARHLRRSSLASDAVPLFEQVVAEAPERLDIRRELAETLIAVGKKDTARALFSEALSGEAEIENFLDLTQFLLAQDFLSEARQAVDRRIENEGEDFELILFLASIDGKQGEISAGEKRLITARGMADTTARYREWLAAATAFYEGDEAGLDSFFASEEATLSAEQTDTAPFVLSFIEAVQLAGDTERTERLLRQEIGTAQSEGNAPSLTLQKLLLEAIEGDTNRAPETLKLLTDLATAEPNQATDYQLRAALIHHRLGRSDLAGDALRSIDPRSISDPGTLTTSRPIFTEYGLAQKALTCADQLTRIEPNDLAHWESLITHLAANGKEDRLRYALRTLLAGGDARPLSAESLTAIRRHFAASTWRSISDRLQNVAPSEIAQTLPLIDDLESANPTPQTRRWLAWARARTLQLANRPQEAEDALSQLTKLINQSPQSADPEPAQEEEKTPTPSQIAFPDGLTASATAALRAIAEPPTPAPSAHPAPGGESPLGNLDLAWGFTAPDGSAIVRIAHHAESGCVLIIDTLGGINALHESSGKIIWSRAPTRDPRGISALSTSRLASSTPPNISPFANNRQQHNPSNRHPDGFALADTNHFYLAGSGSLRCLSTIDGRVLWESPLKQEATEYQDPYSRGVVLKAGGSAILALTGDSLLAYDPGTANAIAFHPTTGKRLWHRDLGDGMPSNALSNGASYAAGHFLVYGTKTHILDASNGETLWTFSSDGAAEFPLELTSPQPLNATPPPPFSTTGANLSNRQGYTQQQQVATMAHARGIYPQQFLSQIQHGGSVRLMNPAAQWHSQRNQGHGTFAHLTAGRLILDNGNSTLTSNLNLPMNAKTTRTPNGALCGQDDTRLLYVGEAEAVLRDLTSGQDRPLDVAEILADPGGDSLLQGTVAGARAYISGPRGTAIFNMRSGQKLDVHLYGETARKFLGNTPQMKDGHSIVASGVANLTDQVLPPRMAISPNAVFVLGGQTKVLALQKKQK